MSYNNLISGTNKSHLTFFLCLYACFISPNFSYADAEPKITAKYYVAKDEKNTNYYEKIQWGITSIPEWTKFIDSLVVLPKDDEKNNPMGLMQPEIIHFNVMNSDLLSGDDIFISKAGIQHFARVQKNKHFPLSPDFREFLELELDANPTYDKIVKEVDINEPGIVVVFRGSSQLKNPSWVIKESNTTVFKKYVSFIDALLSIPDDINGNLIINDALFDEKGTYIIYLNYSGAPFDVLSVSRFSQVRGTKIDNQYFYYKDEIGYFSMFKRQANDNMISIQKNRPEDEAAKKRQEILKQMEKNDLF